MKSVAFTSVFTAGIACLSLLSGAGAHPAVGTNCGVVTLADMKAWVDARDPSLNTTIIGDPFASLASPLSGRQLPTTVVTYCTDLSGTICTGTCTVSSGPGCINTPGTNCLFSTTQVTFCDGHNCGGSCNEFDSCGTLLDNNFCATPGTASIGIPA